MLLTLIQQNSIKQISNNWANFKKVIGGLTQFEEIEKEVENLELSELLGDSLLFDIQTNPTTAENLILLDGAVFKDCFDNDIKFEGIRYQLAYMIYSQYAVQTKFSDTFTGIVEKNREETNNAQKGNLKGIQLRYQKIAIKDFEKMSLYLNNNTEIYPLWNISKSNKAIYAPKVITLRKTYK